MDGGLATALCVATGFLCRLQERMPRLAVGSDGKINSGAAIAQLSRP